MQCNASVSRRRRQLPMYVVRTYTRHQHTPRYCAAVNHTAVAVLASSCPNLLTACVARRFSLSLSLSGSLVFWRNAAAAAVSALVLEARVASDSVGRSLGSRPAADDAERAPLSSGSRNVEPRRRRSSAAAVACSRVGPPPPALRATTRRPAAATDHRRAEAAAAPPAAASGGRSTIPSPPSGEGDGRPGRSRVGRLAAEQTSDRKYAAAAAQRGPRDCRRQRANCRALLPAKPSVVDTRQSAL